MGAVVEGRGAVRAGRGARREEGVVRERVRELRHLALELGVRVHEVAQREERVGEDAAVHRRAEAEGEVGRHQPLLHGEDELPVPIVPVEARLRHRVVVEHARALARDQVVGSVDVGALLVVLEVGLDAVALERRAARRDERVDGLASAVAHREDRHLLVAVELQLRRAGCPRAVALGRVLHQLVLREERRVRLHVANVVQPIVLLL